ncbi:MAG: NAD(P)/FAD-dependent oxidoreductase [Hellea sp.]|nr:NAD(P)/FAD-dependent oxidoreductase [Hellea sp.]
MQYDTIIIGGGHNGLTCAFYLARKGKKVLILERHHEVGGAAFTEEFHPGFRNSVAAYTVSLLQPKVIDDMKLYEHGLEVVLRKVDNFLPYDGGYLLAGPKGLTAKEISRHSKKDAENFPLYEARLDKVVTVLKKFLLTAPPNAGGGFSDLMAALKAGRIAQKAGLETQRDLLDFFTKSAGEILDRYFENEAVKALFGFDAVVGHFASPYEPGSAYVLLHHVFGEARGVPGAWGHAIGGMGAITQAMKSACLAAGVEIRTDSPVSKIKTENGRASAVIANDEVIRAKQIASSVHPKILYERLLDPADLPEDFRWRMSGYKSQSGTFRMNVALSELPKFNNAPKGEDFLTSGIIIAPSLDYMDQAWISAHSKGWSDKPIIEMLIPSTLDDSLAPKGQHVASLFCQQFKFDLGKDRSWDDVRNDVANHIIKTVERYAPGFEKSVIARQINSPLDIERRFGLIGGDIFQGAMSLDQLFSARPVLGFGAYKSPIKGLFMCGSGTHPGGGVTGAPGHNAAHVMFKRN